jgi:Icc-related predicted phosphoesterase
VGKTSQGLFHQFFAHVSASADVLLLCGDFTDYGLPEEARVLAKELTATLKIPSIAVLGNHDYEGGHEQEVTEILRDAGVSVLDGEATEIMGVGFAGVKGFCGGFGRGALGPWGEAATKLFVQAAVDESLKLEAALARLRTSQRIAVLHYSPIRGTVEGEPLEIYRYLGSVFHGHAHRGRAEGQTATGVPVYNVAMPLLARLHPDRPPVRIVEMPIEVPTSV